MRRSRCEISVSVSAFLLGEDVEDGLERAVAAGAVQAQLVAEAAPVVSTPSGERSAVRALIGSLVRLVPRHLVADAH